MIFQAHLLLKISSLLNLLFHFFDGSTKKIVVFFCLPRPTLKAPGENGDPRVHSPSFSDAHPLRLVIVESAWRKNCKIKTRLNQSNTTSINNTRSNPSQKRFSKWPSSQNHELCRWMSFLWDYDSTLTKRLWILADRRDVGSTFNSSNWWNCFGVKAIFLASLW